MSNFLLHNSGFDQLDLAILEELQVNGRITVADLARKIHLSQPAVYQRMKRLERAGIIKQYIALVNRETAGYDVLCFIRLTFQPHTTETWHQLEVLVQSLPAIMECYRTVGGSDVLLKVVVRTHRDLDRFIAESLSTLPGVERIDTTLVLNELKITTALPLKGRGSL